jgi:hypothetical protein
MSKSAKTFPTSIRLSPESQKALAALTASTGWSVSTAANKSILLAAAINQSDNITASGILSDVTQASRLKSVDDKANNEKAAIRAATKSRPTITPQTIGAAIKAAKGGVA